MDDKELDSTVEDGSEGGTADGGKRPKKKYILAGLGIACAVALACGGIYAATAQQKGEPVAAQSEAKAEEKAQPTLSVGVKADGWDAETSTPVIAHIVNEGEGIDFYHAYNANEPEFLDAEADSGFEVSFISPVNADGSIYKVPETAGIEVGGKEDGGLPFAFERVAAEDVSADELTALVASIAEAVKGGDETLMGENGAKVAELVEKNAASNANADAESIAQQAEAVESAAAQSDQSQQAGGNNGGKAPSGGGKGGSSGSPAASGNTGGSGSATKPSGGSGNSGNGGGSGSGSASKPSHTHNWVAQTKTVNHPAEYKTVHHAAVTEPRSICNQCGSDITGSEAAHFKDSLLSGGNCGACHTEYKTIKNAWSEEVLVQNAWTETITIGYKCSCGATK